MRVDPYDIIERKVPQARTEAEADALWAMVKDTEVEMRLGWCPVCCKTKNFDAVGCLTCGWSTTWADYDKWHDKQEVRGDNEREMGKSKDDN